MENHAHEPIPSLPARTRHDGWTGERMAAFLEVLADTGLVSEACRVVGMSREGAYPLRNRDPVFAAAWRAAQAKARPVVADGLLERSITGTVEHYYRDGVLVGERRHYESWLGLAVLKRLDKQAEEDRADGALAARIAGSWQETLDALREGGTAGVPQALESNKVDEVDTPPSPPGSDPFESVWRGDDGAWMTTHAPPSRFDGHQNCEWDGYQWYERACTPEESALLDAHEAAMIEADRREVTDDAEAERDGFFAMLKEEIAVSRSTPPAPPPNQQQHQPAGDGVGDPVEHVAVAMEHRDRLDDLDERTEQRQADGDADQRRAEIGPGAESAERGEGDHVLDLVVGLSGHMRGMRQHGHDEGEDGGAPEEQALGNRDRGRASHDSTGV